MRVFSREPLKIASKHVVSFFCSIENLQDKLPITLPTNYSTKHYMDDNATWSNRL